jgi:hypothetical protein
MRRLQARTYRDVLGEQVHVLPGHKGREGNRTFKQPAAMTSAPKEQNHPLEVSFINIIAFEFLAISAQDERV